MNLRDEIAPATVKGDAWAADIVAGPLNDPALLAELPLVAELLDHMPHSARQTLGDQWRTYLAECREVTP